MRNAMATLVCLGSLLAPVAATSAEVHTATPSSAQALDPAFYVKDPRVGNLNALTQSTRHSWLHYAHDGSRDTTRLIAVDSSGNTRGSIRVRGANNVSWQDVDPGPRHSLVIGDVGDPTGSRRRIAVYRFQEPRNPLQASVARARRFALAYPDGRHDAQAIMVHPTSGRVFVVTNDDQSGGLYRAPRRLSAYRANQLVRVGSAPGGVTGASYAPDGQSYVLGTATKVYHYGADGTLDGVADKPAGVSSGKSLVVRRGGSDMLVATTSGSPSPVYRMPMTTSRTSLAAPTASLLTSPSGAYSDPTTQVGLQWEPVSGAKVQGYRFGYATSDSRETEPSWTSPIIPLASADRPFVFTTLVPGVTYDVFVEVVTTRGKTARTTLQATTAGQHQPGSPTGLSVSDLTSTTMTLNWQAPTTTGSSAIDGYQVGWGTWDSTMLAASARSMNLTNFTADTEYTLRVRAHNSAGYGTWAYVTVRTPSGSGGTQPPAQVPGSPSGLSVSDLTSTTMTLNWQAPTSTGSSAIDGYQVGWGTWDSTMLAASARSMNLTNFTADTEYTLRVRAHNSAGYGSWAYLTVRTPKSSTGTTSPGLLGMPYRVTGVYWTNWNSWIGITDVPTSYNVIYLFAAPRGSTEGSVVWNSSSPTTAQINTVRSRGQRVILSTGGAGNGINFHSRYVSQNFVKSIVAINEKFGGTLANPKIDGVDFNTFEAEAYPNTTEYLWMFAELKRLFGSNFIISSPPAPWKSQDKAMIKEALAQGLMDYAAPQYYDGPGLADPTYIVSSVRDWVRNVAGGHARKIAVGFGMENLPNYSTVSQIQSAWNQIEAEHPHIRGAFVWQHRTDYDRNWAYANTINPLVKD